MPGKWLCATLWRGWTGDRRELISDSVRREIPELSALRCFLMQFKRELQFHSPGMFRIRGHFPQQFPLYAWEDRSLGAGLAKVRWDKP